MIDTGRQFDRNLLRENSTFLQQQKNRKASALIQQSEEKLPPSKHSKCLPIY